MGYPAFYWYPDSSSSSASLETTSFGELLSDLVVQSVQPRADARSLDGALSATMTGANRQRVRIVLERFSTAALVWALRTLESHLQRNQPCAFAVDADKAWAGFCTPPSRGDTVLYTTGNAWMGSGTLAAGDVIVLEGLGSEGIREYAVVSAVSGNAITLAAGLKYTYSDDAVSVRHRWFWPALQWPEEEQRSPLLTTVRELHWTLDAALHTSPSLVQALFNVAGVGGTNMLGTLGHWGATTYFDLEKVRDSIRGGTWRERGWDNGLG
jgi:hypothetical protein